MGTLAAVAPADSLTIFYPMWNEEGSIRLAVDAGRETGDALVAAGVLSSFEVLIVDDASTDATGAIADELAAADPRVRVVHHPENRKLGGALKTGFAEARSALVLYTDGDLPTDLHDSLPKALRLHRLYDADIVSAYRHDRTAEGPRRAVYSFAYNALIRFGFGLRVRDVNFAFKLCRREVLNHVRLASDGSFIDAELLIKAHRLGYHIIQFGVDYFPRTRGISTLSSGSTILKIVRELGTMYLDLKDIEPLPPEVLHGPPPTMASPSPEQRTRRLRRRRAHPAASNAPRVEPRLLIVNADDYGLTEAVSEGILRGHREGVITSTSVLVLAPAFEKSAKWLVDTEALGVGVHLALVGEDPPLLSPREIPTLVDRNGRLPISWKVFLARCGAGRIDSADVRRELNAQLDAVGAQDIRVTHLDSHQHLHLWPMVRQVVLDLAVERGIGAVRVPRSATAVPGIGLNRLASELARAAAARGLAFPGHAVGVDEAGRMDVATIERALVRLGRTNAAAVELSAHPGEAEDPDRGRYRWGYHWGEELAALTDPRVRVAIERHGFVLGTYADLVRSAGPAAR
ncbi:MAG: Cellobiose phosphotransferase system YdjC-like protein [uncultured Acidimicrobiales bacterium]|uniref:Cellobiose phosphotransferase system YdjC-like protein n=1 Tax=uncultured Acidimicrobiales bacterium TaxID=310071 RepID=A0A6J4I9G8_9ACTN|nr:MAG: Cellobiose phosphotransferase system YdjC-like protein [uncultured Acidimicrobiales bacterium]